MHPDIRELSLGEALAGAADLVAGHTGDLCLLKRTFVLGVVELLEDRVTPVVGERKRGQEQAEEREGAPGAEAASAWKAQRASMRSVAQPRGSIGAIAVRAISPPMRTVNGETGGWMVRVVPSTSAVSQTS